MNYLEHHRRKRGLTVAQACKIVGVGTSTWYAYERARRPRGYFKPYPQIREAFEAWSGIKWRCLMEKVR